MSRALLEACFRAALDRASGARAVAAALERDGDALRIAGEWLPAGARLRVLAAGKAAFPMMEALWRIAGDCVVDGLVVTKAGHAVGDAAGWGGSAPRVIEASHPVPDARSEEAGVAARQLCAEGEPGEVLVALLSGGASALLSCPEPGLTPADIAETTSLLLAAGAPIDELNAVRKHLTAASGGRLGRIRRARCCFVMALSDVPGDDPSVIASGPFHGDPSSFADALAVLARRGLGERVPPPVRKSLEAGARGELDETPAPGDAALAGIRTRLLATNHDAALAALMAARASGLEAEPIAQPLSGEAAYRGRELAAWALARPRGEVGCVFVAGGETTVTVRGEGRGGRNQELALAAALVLEGSAGVTLLAAGTDGDDGPTPAAGAFADGGTVARGRAAGVAAREALTRNDSHSFFTREGGVFVTGPTGTNVMDLVLIHVAGRR